MSFQAVVIGAGVDSLVAANLLARSGRQVMLVHDRPAPAHDFGWVPPPVVSALKLSLQVDAPDPWARVLLPEGGKLDLWRDVHRCAESIRALSERDAQRWPHFCRRMATLARLFETLYTDAPADPLNVSLALRVRKLGREGMVDLMRLLPMSVAELLDDWFECDALKGALGAMGILHIRQGPRSGGTAFRFLHHHVGSPEGVFRPARSNIGAVLRARPGVQIKAAVVQELRIRAGQVEGVVLSTGEEIESPMVLSGADPGRTLLELAEPRWLDPELARALQKIRRQGVAARLVFRSGEKIGNAVYAPSLDYLERAYDDVKYARVSRAPYLEAYPTVEGAEVHFQYVPYEAKDDLVAIARRLLPGLGAGAATVMGPAALEREEGWPQGQPYHAELTLDQALWMRPLPELARYATPIEGLWLCGPAMHPGGGISGAAGYNCVQAILKTKGRR